MIQANKIYVISKLKTDKIYDEYVELSILLSEFGMIKYKKDIVENYNTILVAGRFNTYPISERYCAITYFTLKDLKQLTYLRKYCNFTGANYSVVMRLVKKINNFFGRVGIFEIKDLDAYFDVVNVKKEVLEMIDNTPFTLTRGLSSAMFYECSDLTQKETCKLFGVSLPCLKRNLNKVR